MESCSSPQKVLVLDCCYSGAFPAGRVSKADADVHALEKFHTPKRYTTQGALMVNSLDLDAIRRRLAAVADIDWTAHHEPGEALRIADGWTHIGHLLLPDPASGPFPGFTEVERDAIVDFLTHAVGDIRGPAR